MEASVKTNKQTPKKTIGKRKKEKSKGGMSIFVSTLCSA